MKIEFTGRWRKIGSTLYISLQSYDRVRIEKAIGTDAHGEPVRVVVEL